MQKELEKAGQELVDKATGLKDFNAEFEKFTEHALEKWHALPDELLFDFSDNWDIKAMKPLGYPASWIKQTWNDGPPPPPVEDQCPPNCPHHAPVVV